MSANDVFIGVLLAVLGYSILAILCSAVIAVCFTVMWKVFEKFIDF